jgi:hypothetical protein
MTNERWELLEQVSGSAKADILKSLLEAQGINVVLSQEGIGESIYPVAVGPLSEIQIFVPLSQLSDAQKVLIDYNAGIFEDLSYPLSAEDKENGVPNQDQG